LNWTDQELIDGCKRRSAKHEECCYKTYYGYVMGISMSYSKDRDIALEICNDSFMKFFDSIKKLEDAQSLKPWLRRITVNTSIDYYRKNKKFQNNVEADGNTEAYHDESGLDALGFQDILKLINQVQENHRLVFNLYEIEGYSHREIAHKLHITESSSRVYLARAKKQLRYLVALHIKEYEGR